jgi:hypothetical protein
MSDSDVLDAPQIHPAISGFDERWRAEYAAFTRLLPELLKTDRGKYAAVHGGKVVATADTFKDAAMKAYALVGYVPVHVGRVTDQPPAAVRLPSPRVGRPAVPR